MPKKCSSKAKKPVNKIKKVMEEYAEGSLKSGSKHGPKVTSKEQALAIGYSEQRKKNKAKRK